MKIAKLNDEQTEWFVGMISAAVRLHDSIAIGFDDLDQSIKVKIGNGPWSPPVRTEER